MIIFDIFAIYITYLNCNPMYLRKKQKTMSKHVLLVSLQSFWTHTYIYIYVYHDNKTTNNYIDIQTYISLDMCNIYIYTFILPCIIYLVYYCNIYIYMGHGQYLVYNSKSSIFEECIIVFHAPAQFSKNNDVSNTTLH